MGIRTRGEVPQCQAARRRLRGPPREALRRVGLRLLPTLPGRYGRRIGKLRRRHGLVMSGGAVGVGLPRSFDLFPVPARMEGLPSTVVAAVQTPRVRALEDRSAGWVGARAGGGGSARQVHLACLRAEAIVDGAPRGGVVRREDRGAAPSDADTAAPEASHPVGRSGAAHRNLRAASTASLAGPKGVVARQVAQLRCIMSPSQGRRSGTAPRGKADVIGDGRGSP